MKIKISLFTVAIILNLIIVECVIISPIDYNIYDKILDNFLDKPKKELFKVYHFLYNKEYDLNSEEAISRYKIFKNNLKLIKETNEKNLSYKLGIGPFTDISDDEFNSKHLNIPSIELPNSPNFIEFNPKFLKTYTPGALNINYMSHFRETLDQGNCFNNWAFIAVDAVEGNYSLNKGKKIQLSYQELIDCDNSPFHDGCANGYTSNGLLYIMMKGVSNEIDYPLIADNKLKQTCKLNDNIIKDHLIDAIDFCFDCNRDKFLALLQKGPLASRMMTTGENIMKNYKSGIIKMDCSKRLKLIYNIVIIGIGNDTKEGDYYIGRNS